jgi:Fe-S cluster assembly ATP-binding protein
MDTLKITNLSVSVDDKVIIKDFNLEIKSGEIHVIMGPNGTGKSTLTKVIMGDKNYQVLKGDIKFNDKSIKELTTDERARLGIFLGMQSPLEIEGVTNADFLRTAISTKEQDNFKLFEFIKELDKTVDYLKMNKDMIHRGLNQGFSGGERKKNEILQMYMLKPKCILLDEIDSGLDVDSLKIVGNAVMDYYKEYNASILVITHYQRLLNYIKPTHVHVMNNGTIVKSGGAELVKEIEQNGYVKNNKKVESLGTCVVKEMVSHE